MAFASAVSAHRLFLVPDKAKHCRELRHARSIGARIADAAKVRYLEDKVVLGTCFPPVPDTCTSLPYNNQ